MSEDQLKAAIALSQKELENLQAEMQRRLAKRQEENLISIWTEIQAAVRTYANENKIDLVIGYGEPCDKALINLFPNINRKKEATDDGYGVPLFVASEVDISQDVVSLLNHKRGERNKK